MEWKVLGKEQFGLWQKWYLNSHETEDNKMKWWEWLLSGLFLAVLGVSIINIDNISVHVKVMMLVFEILMVPFFIKAVDYNETRESLWKGRVVVFLTFLSVIFEIKNHDLPDWGDVIVWSIGIASLVVIWWICPFIIYMKAGLPVTYLKTGIWNISGLATVDDYSKIKSAIESGQIRYCDLDGGVDEAFLEWFSVSNTEDFERLYDFFVEDTVYHVPKKCLNKGGRICCIDYRYSWDREETYDILFLHY